MGGTGRWLHRFAVLTAAATFLLVVAGALVTSTGSGLAVPDWPLSYGMLLPPMVGGVFYEHGHRMVAGGVGLLTVILAAWIRAATADRAVRRLALAAVLALLLQVSLGGITVLYLLPTPVSVAHAGVAMIFLALVTAIAVMTAPSWGAAPPPRPPEARPRLPRPAVGTMPLPRLAALTAAAVYAQGLLGAGVRHTGGGLACPDFPLCRGQLLPPVDSVGLGLHLAHRAGAVAVAALVGWLGWRILSRHPELRRLAWLGLALVAGQVALGAAAVWTGLAVVPTTAHVAGGALLLATMVVVTLRAYRRCLPGALGPVAARDAAP